MKKHERIKGNPMVFAVFSINFVFWIVKKKNLNNGQFSKSAK